MGTDFFERGCGQINVDESKAVFLRAALIGVSRGASFFPSV